MCFLFPPFSGKIYSCFFASDLLSWNHTHQKINAQRTATPFVETMTGEIFKTFCFADEWTFVPDHFAYSVEHIPSKAEALKYMEEASLT